MGSISLKIHRGLQITGTGGFGKCKSGLAKPKPFGEDLKKVDCPQMPSTLPIPDTDNTPHNRKHLSAWVLRDLFV